MHKINPGERRKALKKEVQDLAGKAKTDNGEQGANSGL
jgi:hypothetical protein